MKKFKSFKVKDESPQSYVGPKYYRLFADVRSRGGPPFELEFAPPDADPLKVLFDHRTRQHSIMSSGLIVTPDRKLLPEWEVPLRASLTKKSVFSLRFEPGGFMPEQVRDLIESLDPGAHIFLPIDLTLPDGTIQRWHRMLWSDDFFGQSVPILDFKANGTEVETIGGKPYYHQPKWASPMAMDPYTFGYIDPTHTRGLHLFATNNLDNAPVISESLAVRLEEMGIAIPKNYALVAMGVVC